MRITYDKLKRIIIFPCFIIHIPGDHENMQPTKTEITGMILNQPRTSQYPDVCIAIASSQYISPNLFHNYVILSGVVVARPRAFTRLYLLNYFC